MTDWKSKRWLTDMSTLLCWYFRTKMIAHLQGFDVLMAHIQRMWMILTHLQGSPVRTRPVDLQNWETKYCIDAVETVLDPPVCYSLSSFPDRTSSSPFRKMFQCFKVWLFICRNVSLVENLSISFLVSTETWCKLKKRISEIYKLYGQLIRHIGNCYKCFEQETEYSK